VCRALQQRAFTKFKAEDLENKVKDRVAPVLQACVRRTLERTAIWGIAMSDVENLLVERWDLQINFSTISQQSSLQKAEAWAEFRQETEDKLFSVNIEARNHEVFCTKLPKQAMTFAGVEFKCRVAAAETLNACVKRTGVLRKHHKQYRRSYNQIEPKIISPTPSPVSETEQTPAQTQPLFFSKEIATRLAKGVGSGSDELSLRPERFFSSKYAPEHGHDGGSKRKGASQLVPQLSAPVPRSFAQEKANAATCTRRSADFLGPGDTMLPAFLTDQRMSMDYGGFGDTEDTDLDNCLATKSKLSYSIDASLDATTRELAGANGQDEIDLRQVFGREYIEELSVNLHPGSKVTVLQRDLKGNTALHLAAWRGDRLACHWLVSNGAQVSALNHDGRSALDFAVHSESYHCMEVILNAISKVKPVKSEEAYEGGTLATFDLALPQNEICYGLDARHQKSPTPGSPASSHSPSTPGLVQVHSNFECAVPLFSWDVSQVNWTSDSTDKTASERSAACTTQANGQVSPANYDYSSSVPSINSSSGDDRRSTKWNDSITGLMQAGVQRPTCDVNATSLGMSNFTQNSYRGYSSGVHDQQYSEQQYSEPESPLSVNSSQGSLSFEWNAPTAGYDAEPSRPSLLRSDAHFYREARNQIRDCMPPLSGHAAPLKWQEETSVTPSAPRRTSLSAHNLVTTSLSGQNLATTTLRAHNLVVPSLPGSEGARHSGRAASSPSVGSFWALAAPTWSPGARLAQHNTIQHNHFGAPRGSVGPGPPKGPFHGVVDC